MERINDTLNKRDTSFDNNLRPLTFADFQGQPKVRDLSLIHI